MKIYDQNTGNENWTNIAGMLCCKSIRIAAHSKYIQSLLYQILLLCGFTDVQHVKDPVSLTTRRDYANTSLLIVEYALVRNGMGPSSVLPGVFKAIPTLIVGSEIAAAEKHRLLMLGGRGYLAAPMDLLYLLKVMREIISGGLWFERAILVRAILNGLQFPMPAPPTVAHNSPFTNLTPRERTVARRAGHGLRNKEIAAELNISDKTVKLHLSRVYRKLAISNRMRLGQLLNEQDFGDSITERSVPRAVLKG